ncbi:DUF2057 domain-containing protein [Vibrio sp. S17_S38]|uniref:YccT family protein n=1 Tax=Vibrio sp. S17_S38 TaxID=2720229 RepID=UPI0016814912|nr:DUF2057 domain-containing protein [Vibrio sp. S17_S38]MBD1571881.1 DUF2057 domain-containing protein [Vibrio sp. S17_S38]
MKSFKILLLAGLIGASFQAAAEVKIHLNQDIKPLVINGEEIGFSLGKKDEFTFDNGQNQIVVQVSKLVESRGEYEKFNSKPIVITFNATNTELTVSPDGTLKTTEDSKIFDKAPKVVVKDTTGKPVSTQQGMLEASNGLTRDYEKEVIAYNKKNQIVLAGEIVTTAPKVAGGATVSKPQEMVEYWYDEASEPQKQAFSAWAFQNRKQVSGELKGSDKPSEMLDYWYKKATPEQRSEILTWLLKAE